MPQWLAAPMRGAKVAFCFVRRQFTCSACHWTLDMCGLSLVRVARPPWTSRLPPPVLGERWFRFATCGDALLTRTLQTACWCW